MTESVRIPIIDPEDADALVDVVESTDDAGVYGIVILHSDWSDI